MTCCLSLCCGGYPRERVSVHDDSSWNFSRWSAKLLSLDFLGNAYLSCRPKPVPTFALAPPIRISLWDFLRKVVSSVSVEKAALRASALAYLIHLTLWQQHSLGSQHVHPHSSLQILHPLTPILQMDISSTGELKGFSQSTQELSGNQEIPVCPHPLWSQLCLNLYPCHFRNVVTGK